MIQKLSSMKRFHSLSIVLCAVAALAFAGCQKGFLDVNEDPNRATEDNITAGLIFTQAEVSVGNRAVGGAASAAGAKLPLQFAQNWIGYMANNGDFARDETETTYDLDFGFANTMWLNYYNVLFDLHQVKVKALASSDTAMAGASMVLSAKLFQNLVDLFGDIPYSQTFQSAEYSHPVYDKAQDIYNALQASLDTAIMYLEFPATGSFISADVIAQGDNERWIKFANTMKLRLLIRQSEVGGFSPGAEIAKIQAKGGVLGAGETVNVNPGFSNQLDKQSPFYANYGYTPSGSKATSSVNANQYIIDILGGSDDPRIGRFFSKAGGDYVGVVYGDEPGNLPSGNQSSYFGPALIGSADQDQWIMTSFESMFLYAEAVARGWIPGNAREAYESAVIESFVWAGVPNDSSAAASYLENADIANWDNAGSSVADQVRFIAFQKYIANTATDPLESYADERRLHFLPAGYISANPGRASNTLPLRLPYVQDEYTTNGTNVKAVGNIDIFHTKIFWEP